MEFTIVYIVVLLLALIASVFVIVTNMRDAGKSLAQLDFRIVSFQLTILLAWIIILARALKADSLEDALINSAVFVFSLVIGVLVIQSVVRENRASELTSKLIRSLSIYNRRLRNLDKQKTDFISLASHQLRSPTSAITGYSSMLLEKDFGELSKDQKEIVKKIFDSGNNLSVIINDLLDTTRIEQNRMRYKFGEFDIVDVVEEICDIYNPLAVRKGLEFIQDFNGDYAIRILGDREKIKQAITNLVDNAIKYTKEGSIALSVSKTEDKVLICVKDTGIGIREDELRGMFNKFIRLSNAEDSNVMGSGLGLFISREIVVANKGEIWAESDGQGKGSKFCVEFKTL
jgi:signal transduction histidine kinase